MSAILGHVPLGDRDIARAIAFYNAVLGRTWHHSRQEWRRLCRLGIPPRLPVRLLPASRDYLSTFPRCRAGTLPGLQLRPEELYCRPHDRGIASNDNARHGARRTTHTAAAGIAARTLAPVSNRC